MSTSIVISDSQIKDVVDCLNNHEADLMTEEGQQLLTVEEVKNNPKLANYLMNGAVVEFDDTNQLTIFIDSEECWNNDCYCDFLDYR